MEIMQRPSVLLASILFALSATTCVCSQDEYHHTVLDEQDRYTLYWHIDDDKQEIILEVHAETLGYVGLGFSPNGGMQDADIIIAGIENQQPYLYAETVRVIWALHGQDAESDANFQKHSFEDRGVQSVLFGNPVIHSSHEELKAWDVTVKDVKVPADYHTYYHCTVLKAPDNITKHHMIKVHIKGKDVGCSCTFVEIFNDNFQFEPFIEPVNKPFVHHMALYHCNYDMKKYVGEGSPCFNNEQTKFSPMLQCNTRMMIGWAIGGNGMDFMQDGTGFPLFEEGHSPYYMLEVHYDNSVYNQNITDNSGLRLWITDKLRLVEIGVMQLGMEANINAIIIPPMMPNYKLSAPCASKCTQNYPAEGLTIMNGFLHTHLAGVAVRVRHFRENVELVPLLEDNYFDFNYQPYRTLNVPRKIMPNDSLLVECEYNTMNKTSPLYTRKGYPTDQEMCNAGLWFYPRMPNAPLICFGEPALHSVLQSIAATKAKVEGEQQLYNVRKTLDDQFHDAYTGPRVSGRYGTNVTLREYTTKFPWTVDEGQKLQEHIDSGMYYSFCSYRAPLEASEVQPNESKMFQDEEMVIEKQTYKYVTLDHLEKPSVPYKKEDKCSNGERITEEHNDAAQNVPTVMILIVVLFVNILY